MAIQNPPGWLQNVGATHTAQQMRNWLGGLFGSQLLNSDLRPAGGVNWWLGNAFHVVAQASPNMSVLVRSGLAYVPGTENGLQGVYAVENDADFTITIAANGSGNPRIDSIFIKVEDTQYSGSNNQSSMVVVQGT